MQMLSLSGGSEQPLEDLAQDVAIARLVAAVASERWDVETDRPGRGVTAMQQQLGEWQTNCIIRPNIVTTRSVAQTETNTAEALSVTERHRECKKINKQILKKVSQA